MPLTPAEKAEMAALEAEVGPKSGGLSESERQEMESLQKELGDSPSSSQEAATGTQNDKPGFFSPGETADRTWEGTKAGIPFLQTLINKAQGKQGYSRDAEGAGRLAGDIGGTALGVASGGIAPLAKFAGLSGALNALGIPQGAARIGNAIEDAMPEPKAPSKVLGVEGLGTALNMLARTPGAAANVTAQALPYALAGKAVAPEAAPVPAEGPIPMQPRPPIAANEMPAGVAPLGTDIGQLLKEHGGELTPGMRATGRVAKAVTGGIEKLAASNPLTQALPEGIRQKNVGAVNSYLEKELNPGVASTSARDFAPALDATLKDYKGDRSARFGEAEAKLAELDSKLPKPVGQIASDRIIEELKSKGVPSDESGFNTSLLTGNEAIDKPTADALIAMERTVRNAKTIPDLLRQRQNIDRSGIPGIAADPGQMGTLKRMARGIVNDTLTKAVESSGDKQAATAWKKANSEYASTASVMRKAGKIKANDLNGPDALTRMLTNPQQGSAALAKLKSNMAPEQWNGVQDTLVNAILDKSKTDGALNADKLKTNMSKSMAHVVQHLDEPRRAVLENAQQMMDKAQIADLRRENPSGTSGQFGKGIHTASMFNPLAWPVLLGETAGLGGYYAGGKAIPAVMDAGAALKSGTARALKSPIPGTSAIPSNIPAILLAAMGSQRNPARGQ